MTLELPLSLTPERLIALTPDWTGERSEDGRPRVSDRLIERIAGISVTEAWHALYNRGYDRQYESGWVRFRPEQVLCGRAMTAVFMPRRPDQHATMHRNGAAAGKVGDPATWPIDQLAPGDVYVADVFGKIEYGPVMGDNLATSIFTKTGNGTVQNTSVRDIEGMAELDGFTLFMRGIHSSTATPTVSLMGINCPARIGPNTVWPGDVVLGRPDGLIFIPPHLAEEVCVYGEVIKVRDIFGKKRLAEGRYLTGQIDGKWAAPIEADFREWLAGTSGLPIPDETVAHLLKGMPE
jgi:regulator of RNase E activity RraA